jgi:hypothetical protein
MIRIIPDNHLYVCVYSGPHGSISGNMDKFAVKIEEYWKQEIITDIDEKLIKNYHTTAVRINKLVTDKYTIETAVQELEIEVKKEEIDTYLSEMSEYIFDSAELDTKFYHKKHGTDRLNMNGIRKINRELMNMRDNLPFTKNSAIYHRYNPNNLCVHEFVITGPDTTPYDSGCYHFTMILPPDYPNSVPHVLIQTGLNSVRFNPNL